MTTARKNTLLLSAMMIGVVSLPMTWFQVNNFSAEFSTGMDEVFGDMFQNMSFEVTGLQGSISWLGNLPFWGAIGIVVLASASQLLAKLSSFDIPVAAQWVLAFLGLFAVTFPLTAVFSGDATVSPRFGWFVALLAATIPVLVLSLPSSDARMATNHPLQPSGEGEGAQVGDPPSPADR